MYTTDGTIADDTAVVSCKRRAEALLLGSSVFLYCIDPQLQGQVFALWIAQVWTVLRSITFAKQIQVKRHCTRQKPHVTAISFYIAFELG
jgi:hypothetical protein